jgi:DNA-binding MarR family transcriptional regulator
VNARVENYAGLLKEVDGDLLNPKRFMIVTLLYALGPMSLRELRRALGLTWGDLDSNVRRLAEKGYVKLWRGLGSGPRVLEVKICLTELGEAEYEKLVAKLRKLLESVEKKRA